MNQFEKAVLKYISIENYEKINKIKIGIAGAGGLGSNCAVNLVRSGVKNLKIVDFDKVDYSNLNRQFYFYNQVGAYKVNALKDNLESINPSVSIETENIKINNDNIIELFSDCQIVIEAFDISEYKTMLIEKCLEHGKTIISVSGLAGWGNSDSIKVRKINDRFYIIGDMKTEICQSNPPLAPRVSIAAGKQVDVILEILWGENVE